MRSVRFSTIFLKEDWYILSKAMDTSRYFHKLNLNPDGKDISDCSTRSLCYCLKEDYSDLREMQNRLSEILTGTRSNWNSHAVFESILMSRNWRKVLFFRKIVRYKLASLLKGNVRIFTESYGHVCPIHNGKIIDTWDCSRGRVASMYVPYAVIDNIMQRLDDADISYIID